MVSTFARAGQSSNSFSDDSLSVQVLDSTMQTFTFQQVDSITYQYYLVGSWDKLIKTGKEAISQQIDYKRLRQRIGYAYFAKADYYSAMKHYEKALAFDKTDSDTRLYLYYCGLYTGNDSYMRYQLSKLPLETRKTLKAKPFKIVDAIDAEYNFKTNDNKTRYNANYGRLGVNTTLGYRLSLYQSVSTFAQSIDSMGLKQNEYFARLNWTITPKINFSFGYHYMNSSTLDSITFRQPFPLQGKKMSIFKDTLPGNLYYSKIFYRIIRFEIGVSGSLFDYNKVLTQQYGIEAGITLPDKSSLNLKSSLYLMLDGVSQRLIYSQSVGALLTKSLWLEGNITVGNLKNYAENGGLYVYNTDDPTVFKTGLTIFWTLSQHLTLLGNYTYNTKLIEKNSTNYNQHSLSGGIIWKI
jgi:hypothetical protein